MIGIETTQALIETYEAQHCYTDFKEWVKYSSHNAEKKQVFLPWKFVRDYYLENAETRTKYDFLVFEEDMRDRYPGSFINWEQVMADYKATQ